MMTSSKIETILSFDFGTKRIGVAVGQTITDTASPLKTISFQDEAHKWQQIDLVINEWRPDCIIVGIPYNIDGTEQPLTSKVRNFINQLKERHKLPIYEVDERLTTIEARQQLFNKGGYKALKTEEIDSYAAKIILETWLKDAKIKSKGV